MKKWSFKKQVETLPDAPPSTHAHDTERGVLSCLLASPDTLIPHAAENIPADAFHHVVHKMVFEEIIEFGMKGDVTLDLITISQRFIDRGLMEKIGGPAFLSELFGLTPTTASYPYYLKILKEKFSLRTAWHSAEKIKQDISSSGASEFNELSENVLDGLSLIRSAMAGSEAKEKSWDEELDEWAEEWDLMASGKKESSMSLRWPCFNSEAGGLQPGYTIISGTSSSGKSTLLGNVMVDSCIRNKRPGLYASYEMPTRMVVSRLVADIADVDGMHLFQPDRSTPTSEIKKAIFAAMKVVRTSKLRIIHHPRMSAEGVCHMARKMFIDQGDIVLGVDYLQLIPKPLDIEKNSNREREVAVNSATLRTFSKEIDRPVLALSQLNQDGSTRESGSINMDADAHFKVDRDKDNKTGRVTEKGVWVYKSRNGASSFHLPLYLDGPKFRFEERIKK